MPSGNATKNQRKFLKTKNTAKVGSGKRILNRFEDTLELRHQIRTQPHTKPPTAPEQ